MCRVFGCVAAEPISIRHELLEAENPLIRQSEEHDSGWGMAVYERAEGDEPTLVRFPRRRTRTTSSVEATELRGRIFNVHVRRATMGGSASRTRIRSASGSYTLGHNGTIMRYPRLLEPGMRRPEGDTDSEHLFNFLMHDFDDGDPVACLRETMRRAVECSPFSGLNFLFTDGEKLFAYRLGLFELHWLARPGQLMVASEQVTDEPGWHSVQQDVLLTLDPNDLEEPHAERLLGDELLERPRSRRSTSSSAPARRGTRRLRPRSARRPRRPPGEPPLRAARQPGFRPGDERSKLSRSPRNARSPGRRSPHGDHAQHRPRLPRRRSARRRPGETVVALGGDGLLRPLAGALQGTEGALAMCRAAAATTSPACWVSRPTPATPPRLAVEGDGAPRGRRERRGHARSSASPASGFDSDANRIANEAKLVTGNAVYLVRGAARARRLEAGALQRDRRRRAPRPHRLLGGGGQLEGLRRRHVRAARRPSSTTAGST